jgi:hypothetical protein
MNQRARFLVEGSGLHMCNAVLIGVCVYRGGNNGDLQAWMLG